MALVVEDGTGLATADTYVSVADVDTYNTDYVGNAAWTAALTPAKELAIRQATAYLDDRYSAQWKGVRKTDTQALSWPRSGASDCDGYAINEDSLPQDLVDACAELAIKGQVSNGLVVDDTVSGIKGESVKVDVLEKSTEYSGVKSSQTDYVIADRKLNCLLEGGVNGTFIERS